MDQQRPRPSASPAASRKQGTVQDPASLARASFHGGSNNVEHPLPLERMLAGMVLKDQQLMYTGEDIYIVSKTTHDCSLMRLPAELRLMIWEYTVTSSKPIPVKQDSRPPYGGPQEAGLLATCRQIRKEALDMFYKNNSYSYEDYDPTGSKHPGAELEKWLQKIGPEKAGKIRMFVITYNPNAFVVNLLARQRCDTEDLARERAQILFESMAGRGVCLRRVIVRAKDPSCCMWEATVTQVLREICGCEKDGRPLVVSDQCVHFEGSRRYPHLYKSERRTSPSGFYGRSP